MRRPHHAQTRARLSQGDVEQLIDLHLRGRYPVDHITDAEIFELLRLAHLGAAAEREATIEPKTLNRSVVDAIGSRWARMTGTP